MGNRRGLQGHGCPVLLPNTGRGCVGKSKRSR